HPEVVQRVLHGAPAPPSALARRPSLLEVAVGHRPVSEHGGLDALEYLAVPPQARPARVTKLIVEHGAAPPRQHGGGHQAGGVRPVLEEQAAAIDLAGEPCAIVRAEAAAPR